MSDKERDRMDVFGRVSRSELTLTTAADLLNLSLRQCRRLMRRFESAGAAGLVHKLRGRTSNFRIDMDLRRRVLQTWSEHFRDFGPTLACEKLAEQGLKVSADTLTRWLKQEGLWERRRRRGKHRRRRERRACLGSMVQIDGSEHDWFEGRDRRCVLMELVDDATGLGYARFYPSETTEAVFDVLSRWFTKHGLPRAIYSDRHSIYRDEDHPDRPTQVGRALGELGVELIQARSPQAKGRVERRHGLMQDRLVKEMRLRNIRTIEQANALLDGMFMEDMNRRYAVKAKRGDDLHRRMSPSFDLAGIMCVREKRVVGKDWCVRWKNRLLQIAPEHERLSIAGKTVWVKQLADRQIRVEHEGRILKWTPIDSLPTKRKTKKPIVKTKRWIPPKTHPWKATINLQKTA